MEGLFTAMTIISSAEMRIFAMLFGIHPVDGS
jgi:hypothetical protein